VTKKITFHLQIKGPELDQKIVLKTGESGIGREPSNKIQLNFPKVSRHHARIDSLEASCHITDLGSANGTLVNGTRIEPNIPVSLSDNTVIEIDPVTIICKHIITDVEEKPPEVEPKASTRRLKEEEKIPKEAAPPKPEPEKKKVVSASAKAPPPAKPPTPPRKPPPDPKDNGHIYPGLSEHSTHLLNYLPGIYHTDFLSRLLALFESILVPIEWNVDSFDLFLHARSAPYSFLPWLSNWFDIVFDASWNEDQRRMLLSEASRIYSRRGTRWALSRVLEIYTGKEPTIVEFTEDLKPHTFKITVSGNNGLDKELITRIIDSNKPAHTTYKLTLRGK
jgi:phage tail-like protein